MSAPLRVGMGGGRESDAEVSGLREDTAEEPTTVVDAEETADAG